ncbi:MAG: NAD(P)H-hydrate dehydratase [Clostridia bacterium]|nr:NAD(P)H-hydrate dehydratase [Clostridia bacterium]
MTSFPILTAAQMKACDDYTIHTLGVPSRVLMERAAAKAVAFLLDRTDLFPAGPVVLLCGSGNNGGDGLAMARFLTDGSAGEKRKVTVIYAGKYTEAGNPDESRMSEECRRQYLLARAGMVTILPPAALGEVLADAAVVVDAVFGIGLDRLITGEIASLLTAVAEGGVPVLAVDIPSGVNADTGAVMGVALPAMATVTMQALKAGLLLYPGAELCGEIAIADLGIDLTPAKQPFARLADEALLRRVLPPRKRRSHKGTYGLVSLLCGSEGMSGAAVLATRGALRSGVGLVRVLTPDCNRAVLQTAAPEAIVSVYDTPERAAGCAEGDALVLGCGLGVSDLSREALRSVLKVCPADGTVPPAVLDADGINHAVKDPSLWGDLLAHHRQVIVTPHPMEMSRLCGKPVPEILAAPVEVAKEFAATWGVTVVLKDAHTVIASPEGELFICAAGNAGMARGGSGDVLAGIIGSLLAQNRARIGTELTVTEIAAAGVYLHAKAGDLAAEEIGEYGMLPGDLIERLPLVCKELSDSRTIIQTV